MYKQYIYFSLIFFALAMLCVLEVRSSSQEDSRNRLARYRQMFSVKLGTTSDPFLSLASSTEVDLRTQEKKFSNRNRTLRAYLMKQKGGIVRLAFESAKPHAFFQLTGNYAVSPETVGIVWKDNSMVSFDGVNTKGLPTHFEFRLNDLEMKETSLPQLSVQILAPVIDVD